MVGISVKVSSGAACFRVSVQAQSIERALEIVQRQNPGKDCKVSFPIDTEPFFVDYNLSAGIPTVALIPILLGLVFGVVGWTIVNTWIYNSTESIFLMIVLHGWYNTVNAFLVLPFENMTVATVNAVLPWAVAVFVSKRHGDEHLTDSPRPTRTVPTSQSAALSADPGAQQP